MNDDLFTEARRCEGPWPDDVSYVIKELPPATKYPTQIGNPGVAGMLIFSALRSVGREL